MSKLVKRIYFGRSGRKGKKSDAPAILNMLPKLALVAMKHTSVYWRMSSIPIAHRPLRSPALLTVDSLISCRTQSSCLCKRETCGD